MCLAIPGKIMSIETDPDLLFSSGTVSFGGIQKKINLSMVADAKVGNYVLVHVGVAISIIDEEEAQRTYLYLQQMGEMDEFISNPN